MSLNFRLTIKAVYAGICASCKHENMFLIDNRYATVICKEDPKKDMIRSRIKDPSACLHWKFKSNYFKRL